MKSLFAKSALVFLALILPIFAGGETCQEYTYGSRTPQSGTCSGTYNACQYIVYSSTCTCPNNCWNPIELVCGVGWLSRNCNIWNDAQVDCQARSGCTWNPYNPCSNLLGNCNQNTPCCSGLECKDGYCKLPTGSLCSSPNECYSGNCVERTPGAQGVCCYAQNQEGCLSSYECCSQTNICRRESANTISKCLPCANQNQYCASDADCCSGLFCQSNQCKTPPPPNQPPETPAPPSISPEGNAVFYLNGNLTCTANCPPNPLPADPEGQAVTMSYLWFRNGAPIGNWGPYFKFVCSLQGCAAGQTIYLKSRACDPQNFCSEAQSNPMVVQAPVPSLPAVPNIAPIGNAVTTGTGARCTNCPPNPMPTEPISGNPATIQYSWIKSGTASPWSNSYYDFSCLSAGCAVGDQIGLKVRACNPSIPSVCTQEVFSSSTLIVEQATQPTSTGSINLIYSIYALGAAIGIISLAFMASYIFNLPHIRPIIQDELLQVLATGAILLGIVGVNSFVDAYVANTIGAAANREFANVQSAMDAAKATLVGLEGKAKFLYEEYSKTSMSLGKEGSKGVFCSFLGVGFSLVNCSPFNAFRGSVTTAAFAATGALADVYAQQYLLSLARNLSFTFFIPLGLLLRCFKFSRAAGGALIAIGFGFYTVYPIMIVSTNEMLHGSNHPTPSEMQKYEYEDGPRTYFTYSPECDPSETDSQRAKDDVVLFAFNLTDYDRIENMAYIILVRIIFSSILVLIVTLAFIRAFAHILGSDIDVTALARIS